MQVNLFSHEQPEINTDKTYRAIRHDVTRTKQKVYSNAVHHPEEKSLQIKKVLGQQSGLKILELFAGQGNCTNIYQEFGQVLAVEKKQSVFDLLTERMKRYGNVNTAKQDSFLFYHKLIFEKRKYDVVDLDPYGFPNRFFPDVFLLIDKGTLFLTMPKPYVNILNGITASHLISYYGEQNPSVDVIVDRVALWGLCHWRKVELIDRMDCKSVWRFAFDIQKVKATDYTGVRNR